MIMPRQFHGAGQNLAESARRGDSALLVDHDGVGNAIHAVGLE